LKESNVNYSYNEGDSNSYEPPVDNGIIRSDKGSASEGEDVQENLQDSILIGHELDPSPSQEIDIDEESAEPGVQDCGSSQDDALNHTTSDININNSDGNADKETCIFFLEGSCGSGSGCDFSHSIPKNTETASSGRRKGPKLSKSNLYSSFSTPDHVAHRILHCAKALRLATQENLQALPPGELPTREGLQISPPTGPADCVRDQSSRYFH
jgi:hypothetical protein